MTSIGKRGYFFLNVLVGRSALERVGGQALIYWHGLVVFLSFLLRSFAYQSFHSIDMYANSNSNLIYIKAGSIKAGSNAGGGGGEFGVSSSSSASGG